MTSKPKLTYAGRMAVTSMRPGSAGRPRSGLGTTLVFELTAQCMPGAYDEVRQMFRKRGAYGRLRSLIERNGQLQAWYEFRRRQSRCVTGLQTMVST